MPLDLNESLQQYEAKVTKADGSERILYSFSALLATCPEDVLEMDRFMFGRAMGLSVRPPNLKGEKP